MGAIDFWTLAIKPGRPMAFGRVTTERGSALLFGLPGNPVAVMVVFYALVREALLAMGGETVEPLVSVRAICDTALPKAAGRTDFVRGVLIWQTDGWHVRATQAQGSGVLRSMSEANGLIVLGHEHGPVTAGDRVDVWPFHGLI
jgi:molybdopterin molybdotransferase